MRFAILAAAIVSLSLGAVSGRAQSLLSGKPSPQYATITPSSSAPGAAPGGAVTLWADVVPHPKMHVYGEGAKDFTPVSLVVTPNPSVTRGKVAYPKPALVDVPGTTEKVPAYSAPFRITLPVSIARTAKPGETLTIGAALNYQACDDRLCYPATVAPVVWRISIK